MLVEKTKVPISDYHVFRMLEILINQEYKTILHSRTVEDRLRGRPMRGGITSTNKLRALIGDTKPKTHRILLTLYSLGMLDLAFDIDEKVNGPDNYRYTKFEITNKGHLYYSKYLALLKLVNNFEDLKKYRLRLSANSQ